MIQIPAVFVPGDLDGSGCNEFGQPWGHELFFTYATFTLYIIPLIVIVPCYTRIAFKISTLTSTSVIGDEATKHRLAQRKRTIIGIFVVVVFYILMWLPLHMVHLWMAFDPDITAATPLYIELHTAANVLLYVNSSVNPYLYTLAGSSFRKHLVDIGHYCLCGFIRKQKPKGSKETGTGS